MSKESKNQQIKDTLKDTKNRRSSMRCVVYEVKVVANKMSCAQTEEVNTLFREAKWMRNYVVSDVNNADRNARCVPVKTGDTSETRKFTILGSQSVQDIYDSVKSNIKTLSINKKKGKKVGVLKFKSFCNSVPLRQYGNTYKINFNSNTIKIVNIKKLFKVRGLKQIPADAEIANAKFVRKASGLYFHITVYVQPEAHVIYGKSVGVDFGISHNLTTSKGDTYDVYIKESKSTKLLAKKMNKSFVKNGRTKTKNHNRRKGKLRIAYEHEKNKRLNEAHKIVHELGKYDLIAIQDEMIHNWHSGLFGKQVQHSAMGTIKAGLKSNPRTVVIKRSFPSTQLCPECGCLTKHDLSQREYNCQHCGYHHDNRDVKAAITILTEALRRQQA